MSLSSVKRVAVIGAGISGVTTAAHLKNTGLEVSVFERSAEVGGVWIYDPRQPLEPTYPAERPHSRYDNDRESGSSASSGSEHDGSETDYQSDDERRILQHAPPGPCYLGLTNNVSTPLLETSLTPFPAGTPDYVSHEVLCDYIKDVAKKSGVDNLIKFNTDVRSIKEIGGKWTVETITLQRDQADSAASFKRIVTEFDSVVIASGHYHTPRVPDIPGLAKWKRHWPDRVEHSKRYRRPEVFQDKNVLLVGAGVSSTDIAKELGPIAKTIYQVHRNGKFDLPGSMLPPNGIRVGEIESFSIGDDEVRIAISTNDPLPGIITLKDGTKLCDIHHVILATGYHVSLPLLAHLHSDLDPEDADDKVLVTDGTQYHNLHKDIFYIPQPTLAFIGVPYFTATFTLFEFQAIVLAQVLSGHASLPAENEMREEYKKRVEEKGYGKPFHSLRDGEVEYVNELLAWVNPQLEEKGLAPLKGHTESWKRARADLVVRMQKLFAGSQGQWDVQERAIPSCL